MAAKKKCKEKPMKKPAKVKGALSPKKPMKKLKKKKYDAMGGSVA